MKIKIIILVSICLLSVENCFSQKESHSTSACSGAIASQLLSIGQIETIVFTGGDMGWNLFGDGKARYRFPKTSSKNCGGASGLWIGGIDAGGQLKIAAQTYRQSGHDFWPGPLDTTNGSTSSNICFVYDKIWKVDYNDINNFLVNYYNGNIAANTYTPTNDILTWPYRDTVNTNVSKTLSPIVDMNSDGNYKPKTNGDYPKLKGDQMLYYIINDKGDIHTSTGGQSIGLEIHVSAYAYGCPSVIAGKPELTMTTFYHFKIFNRSPFYIRRTAIGLWSDATIGDGKDDFIGSNVGQGYGFVYNGDGNDSIYGSILPATALVLLKGPPADPNDGIDNDGDLTIDEPMEEIGIPDFYYYLNNFSGSFSYPAQMSDPVLSSNYYNYMTGYWRDGSPYTCGGNAWGGSTPTKSVFMDNYPPTTACGTGWNESSAGNTPGDRAMLCSAGTFTLLPGTAVEVEFAFVTSVDSTSPGDPLASVTKLQSDVQKVKNFYNLPVKPNCLTAVGIDELSNKPEVMLSPNPATDLISIKSGNKMIRNIEMVSLIGQKVVVQKNISSLETTIDVHELPQGLYILNVIGTDWKTTKKFVKE